MFLFFFEFEQIVTIAEVYKCREAGLGSMLRNSIGSGKVHLWQSTKVIRRTGKDIPRKKLLVRIVTQVCRSSEAPKKLLVDIHRLCFRI